MIQISDIVIINQDLRTGFDRNAFEQFLLKEMALRLEDYASTNNFIIQLTECLSRLKLEGRLPELLIKAAVCRPNNADIKKWADKALIIDRAQKNPKSIVTLGGTKIFIGRDDLKQKIGNNLKSRKSWVLQLHGKLPKSGVSHCYWYIKHRAGLLGDVDVKEINLKKINEEEEVVVHTSLNAVKFVVLYEVEDEDAAQQLRMHLIPLVRSGKILVHFLHSDTRAGEDPIRRVEDELRTADYALCLITAHFVSGKTLDFALKSGRRVIPVRVGKVSIDDTGLENIQSVPSRGRTVSDFANKDEGWMDVVTELRKLLVKY